MAVVSFFAAFEMLCISIVLTMGERKRERERERDRFHPLSAYRCYRSFSHRKAFHSKIESVWNEAGLRCKVASFPTPQKTQY